VRPWMAVAAMVAGAAFFAAGMAVGRLVLHW